MYVIRRASNDGLLYPDVIKRMAGLATTIVLGSDYKVKNICYSLLE